MLAYIYLMPLNLYYR